VDAPSFYTEDYNIWQTFRLLQSKSALGVVEWSGVSSEAEVHCSEREGERGVKGKAGGRNLPSHVHHAECPPYDAEGHVSSSSSSSTIIREFCSREYTHSSVTCYGLVDCIGVSNRRRLGYLTRRRPAYVLNGTFKSLECLRLVCGGPFQLNAPGSAAHAILDIK